MSTKSSALGFDPSSSYALGFSRRRWKPTHSFSVFQSFAFASPHILLWLLCAIREREALLSKMDQFDGPDSKRIVCLETSWVVEAAFAYL